MRLFIYLFFILFSINIDIFFTNDMFFYIKKTKERVNKNIDIENLMKKMYESEPYFIYVYEKEYLELLGLIYNSNSIRQYCEEKKINNANVEPQKFDFKKFRKKYFSLSLTKPIKDTASLVFNQVYFNCTVNISTLNQALIPENQKLIITFKSLEKYIAKHKNISRINSEIIAYLQNKSLDKLYFITTFYPQYISAVNADFKTQFPIDIIDVPDYQFQKKFGFSRKTINKNEIELGKLLFFDPILSGNNKRACAGCHKPEKGFADGLAKSIAFDFNGTVDRNAPTILHSLYSEALFYDKRSQNLQQQITQVIENPKEFNTNFKSIIEKLKTSSEYKAKFKSAYSTDTINDTNIAKALQAYILSISNFNSTFDKVLQKKATLDSAQTNGFNLYFGSANCAQCHIFPLFSGSLPPSYQYSNTEILGVPKTNYFDETQNILDDDLGIEKINKNKLHRFAFKTLTVRNIAYTSPYMHNGIYKTLEEVITFYNVGGGYGLELQVPSQTLSKQVLRLSPEEKDDLISFLNTLNDTINSNSKPTKLPSFTNEKWNNRPIGGEY